MSSHAEIAARFADQAGRPHTRLPRCRSGNVYVHPCDDRSLLSYGPHFVLARIMLDDTGARSWWLLNGDTYSVSTTRHQAIVRTACHRTGLPVLIVPFSCLREAGIDIESIRPVDIRSERFESITHHAATRDEIPEPHRPVARRLPDGRWAWTTARHWLGAALFRADYPADYPPGDPARPDRIGTRTASFLSAFDEQETRPHYFLCELPHDAHPDSVAEAIEALKPPEVRAADAAGLPVVRQGDVFAIPTTLTTRHLPRKRERGAHVLHLSHTATEVCVTDDGTTYARGVLRHAPTEPWRAPEHRRQRMGDRTTWHQVVKNTVPFDIHGNSRAWSRAGNVD